MTFVPRPGLDAALLRMNGLEEALVPLAEAGAAAYADDVPVLTGAIQEEVFSSVALTSEGWRGRFGSTAPHAALVEFGTVDNPPDGSLRRAAEGLGADFEPDPRRS